MRNQFFYRSRWMILAFAAVAIASIAFTFSLLPPRYAFEFDGQKMEREDILSLGELKAELEHTIQWKPEYTEPDAIENLAIWIRSPSNENAKSLTDLMRVGGVEFSQVNGMIKALDSHTDIELSRFRDRPLEGLKSDLLEKLQGLARADRDAALWKIANLPKYSSLITRFKCPSFPEQPGFIRQSVSQLLGTWIDDRHRWVKGFTKSFDANVQPIFAQYQSMDRQNAIRLELDGSTLVLQKRLGLSVKDTVYMGSKSTTNFDLKWIPKSQGEESPSRIYDTGLRLVCLPWSLKENGGQKEWRPQWPPPDQNLSCLTQTTLEFLVALGAPSGLLVTPGTSIQVQQETDTSATELVLRVSAKEDPTWRSTCKIRLDGQSQEGVRIQIREATKVLQSEFTDHLLSLKSLCSCPVQLNKTTENHLAGVLKHPTLGDLTIKGYPQGDLTTIWKAELSQDDRKRCIDQLIASTPSLQGHASKIRLIDIEFDTKTEDIRCRFATTSNAKSNIQPERIGMSLNGLKQAPEVVVPEKLSVLDLPKDTEASKQAQGIQESLLQQVQTYLGRNYPKLSQKLAVPRTYNDGTNDQLTLSLRIEEWPALELGPVAVQASNDIPSLIDDLLSERTIKTASESQWREMGEYQHPKYGKVRGRIQSWNPSKPEAVVKYELELEGLGPFSWNDTFKLVGQEWTGLDPSDLLDACEAGATEILGAVGDAMGQYMPGGLITVSPDPKAIDGVRWLSLQPFRMSFRASTSPSVLGEAFSIPLSIRLDGIIADRDGLHVPEEFGVDVPLDLPTPYFSVARPFLLFSYKRPALRIGGHFVPPGPLPRAWVGILSNEASIKGYWEEPKFEGNSNLTIAQAPGVASGNLIADLKGKELEALLEGGGRLPGLPTIPARVGGKLKASGSTNSMSISSQAELLGVDVVELSLETGGKPSSIVDRRLASEERTLNLRGRLGLPRGLSMSLDGQSSSDLKKYTVVGVGKLLTLTKKVVATEQAVQWENMEMTPLGPFHFDEWSASLGTLNSAAERSSEEPVNYQEATEVEKEYAEKNFRRRTVEWWESPFRTPRYPEPEIYRSVNDLQLELRRGNLVGTRTSIPNAIEFEIPSDRLPNDIAQNHMAYLTNAGFSKPVDPQAHSHLLMLNPGGINPAWHITLSSSNEVLQSEPFSVPLPENATLSPKLFKHYCNRYFRISHLCRGEMTVRSNAPRSLSSPQSVWFDYTINESQGELPATAMFLEKDQQLIRCDLHLGILGKSDSQFFSSENLSSMGSQLKLLGNDPKAFSRLVYLDQDDSIFGWYSTTSFNADEGKLTLIEKSNSDTFLGQIEFHTEPGLALAEKLRLSGRLLKAAHTKPEIQGIEVWIGPKGILGQKGEMLYIIQSNDSSNSKVAAFRRADFDRWSNPETEDLLPLEWSTQEKRKNLSLLEIGSKAMSEDFATANRTNNPASWFGLLQSLHRDEESEVQP